MALLGKTNRLKIKRFVDFGAFLDGGNLGEILLPEKWVPEDAKEGQMLEAFVYRDSQERLIATTQRPYAEVDECAFLEVVEVSDVGAFLDWGLEKDLFLPFAEQRERMKVGRRYVVYIYVDNTGRLAASTKFKKFLPSHADGFDPPYREGDEVDLFIVSRTDLGWEATVDDSFLGLVHDNDALDQLELGTQIDGYIKEIRPDGLVNLSLQSPAETRDELGQRILANRRKAGGSSPLTDKSDPDAIFDAYGVSKRAYKAAIGGLYRERLITLHKDRIELVKD